MITISLGKSANSFTVNIWGIYCIKCSLRKKLYFILLPYKQPLYSQTGRDNVPIGTIWPYVGDLDKIPTGWHLCDGTDGTPNLIGQFLQGSNSPGSFIEPGLPNITGSFWSTYGPNSGAFYYISSTTGEWHAGDYKHLVGFNASLCSTIYKDECTTVQPPAYTAYYIIKLRQSVV